MGPSKRKGSVRRQVLDLNTTEDSPSRPTWQTKYQHVLPGEEVHQNGDSQTSSSPIVINNPLSGLLGNYNSDSDSEESTQKPASNLDAKVEDFLKEIQLISVETTPTENQAAVKQTNEQEVHYPSSVTAWQQCYDHNSGYPYYWNTETNEVTWEMPADLKAALASVALKHQQQKQEKPQKQQPKSEPETQKKVCKYPWQTESDSEDEKIEMITSFGPQSGEESEGEEQKKPSGKTKKSDSSANPSLPAKSLSYINPSKIRSDSITLAPEDPEGLNESSYETSSLLTHGVQDTGPPGDESFNSAKSTFSAKVPASSTKEESAITRSKSETTDSRSESSSVQKNVSGETLATQKQDTSVEETVSECKDKPNEVIAQTEKEILPDSSDNLKTEKQITLSEVITPAKTDPGASQTVTGNPTSSSLTLVANYGDDSESEDNSTSEKRKNSSKINVPPSKPLFPIEIPQEKVKPLFPCMGGELPKINVEVKPKVASQDEPEPVSNIYNTELDDPAAQKAFKRKKRIEFATTVYGPSTSKSQEVKAPEHVVSVPTTQYNLDPNSNDHHGFGFNARKSPVDTERKTYKNYGGIQFIKAETINLAAAAAAAPEPKEKCETEIDNSSAPRSSSKESVKSEEIEDAASLLREKVTFLTGGTSQISPIQQMAIELETLVLAWQHGALTPSYLLRWLNEKCSELIRHEKTAAPPGWTCLWDRKSKRYFYRNTTTKAILWEYPNVEEKSKGKDDVEGGGDEMDICDTPPHMSPAGPERQTDETPSTPPPPVISDVSENVSSQSPTPQPPPPPQISFCPENESSSAKIAKKKKRKAEEMCTSGEVDAPLGASAAESVVSYDPSCEKIDSAPPLPPMPPPPPPPPAESPPPLPDSPPPLPLEPDQPLPPGVDEPEYTLYRPPKNPYKKSQTESPAYSAELMMTYGYGLPVQQVVSSNSAAMTMQMQPLEYHAYMHEPVTNHYMVQSAPTSHVIHCPAKKPKPSIASELVSFYSDLAMMDSSTADNANTQTVPSTPAPPKEAAPAPPPVQTTTTVASSTSTKSSVASSSAAPIRTSDSVTSNGVKKKKKTKTTSTLSLKKKGVSSLVAKWQQVQQEVRRDFSDDDDDALPAK